VYLAFFTYNSRVHLRCCSTILERNRAKSGFIWAVVTMTLRRVICEPGETLRVVPIENP